MGNSKNEGTLTTRDGKSRIVDMIREFDGVQSESDYQRALDHLSKFCPSEQLLVVDAAIDARLRLRALTKSVQKA